MDRRLSKQQANKVMAAPKKSSTIMTTTTTHRNTSAAALIPADQDNEPDSSHQALELLHELTIDQLNEIFMIECSHLNIEGSLDPVVDRSPECIADQLTASATGLYLIFSEQHPQLSEQTLLERFSNMLLESFTAGYTVTREVLDNLNLLDDEEVTGALEHCYEQSIDNINEFCISFGFAYDEEHETDNIPIPISADEFLEEESLEELMI